MIVTVASLVKPKLETEISSDSIGVWRLMQVMIFSAAVGSLGGCTAMGIEQVMAPMSPAEQSNRINLAIPPADNLTLAPSEPQNNSAAKAAPPAEAVSVETRKASQSDQIAVAPDLAGSEYSTPLPLSPVLKAEQDDTLFTKGINWVAITSTDGYDVTESSGRRCAGRSSSEHVKFSKGLHIALACSDGASATLVVNNFSASGGMGTMTINRVSQPAILKAEINGFN